MAKAVELGKRYNINAFPSFYYFSGGKMRYRYHGGHQTESFLKFCQNPEFIEPPKTEGGFEGHTNVTVLANNADVWIKVKFNEKYEIILQSY